MFIYLVGECLLGWVNNLWPCYSYVNIWTKQPRGSILNKDVPNGAEQSHLINLVAFSCGEVVLCKMCKFCLYWSELLKKENLSLWMHLSIMQPNLYQIFTSSMRRAGCWIYYSKSDVLDVVCVLLFSVVIFVEDAFLRYMKYFVEKWAISKHYCTWSMLLNTIW